jgi:hypothetical protein
LPGDLVVTCDYAWLYPGPASFGSGGVPGQRLDDGTQCLVINVAPAGSAGGGHTFFVMTAPDKRFGWLMNYDVRPFVTQREPETFR